MHRLQTLMLSVALLAVFLLPIHGALAQTNKQTNNGPKPLTALPSTSAAPDDKTKLDPSGIPKEYAELRQKVKDEFNAWMKDDNEIQKQCEAVHSVAEHALCDRKKQASQARLDVVHAHTRDMLRKIDTWRRKQAGLPPPEWWPPENSKQRSGQNSGNNNAGGATQKESPALLPQSSAPLPAGTF